MSGRIIAKKSKMVGKQISMTRMGYEPAIPELWLSRTVSTLLTRLTTDETIDTYSIQFNFSVRFTSYFY
jgi:hypothetical protein